MVVNNNWIEFVCLFLICIVKSELFFIKYVFKFRLVFGGRKFVEVLYYEVLYIIFFRK